MKKKIAVILCLVLVLSLSFVFAGCVEEDLGAEVGKISLTIDCKTILNNMDKLDTGIKEGGFVPKDGVMLDQSRVKLYEKDNLLSVVKRVCKKEKIKLDVVTSQYGAYISGVGNITENSCNAPGGWSGWLFLINGEMPEVPMDKIVLKDGDVVRVAFTCEFGDVK